MKNPENKTLEFIYQEKQVHFLVNPTDKNVMINATEMANVFGKRTTNYLANDKTKELISKLELTGKSVNSDFKVLENRGHMGYYFNEILALDFAAWLDVDFKIWIYKTIRDLLTKETKLIKASINEIKCAEIELSNAIETAKRTENKEAIAIIEAFQKCETAKNKKGKALRRFNKQISMDI